MPILTLDATVRRSDGTDARTCGQFTKFVMANAELLEETFGESLFPGSLNLDIVEDCNMHERLDAGDFPPTFSIPRRKLQGMAPHLGDAQAWRAELQGEKIHGAAKCWLFRRINSKVPKSVLEVVATEKLAEKFGLENLDEVQITIFYDTPVMAP